MISKKPLIFDLSYETLKSWFKNNGQPAFRTQQVWTAIYQNYKTFPDEITTLPKELREKLDETFDFVGLVPIRSIQSADRRTIKTLFQLRDQETIEVVLMYYEDRRTLCISSQCGCAIGCSFCATGQMGFTRNLTSGEIIAQVLYFARRLAEQDDRVTNVVMMGMGEPFLNYDNLMDAMERLNHPDAFGLGARRITISTVGIVPNIIAFANEELQYNLAISLHTVDDELRSELIPINNKYSVDEVIKACRYYIRKTSRRVTFEVALIKGVNDSVEDAEKLANKIGGMICHVNIIPLNPTKGYDYEGTDIDQVSLFAQVLNDRNIPCTVRLRRGIEIQAGCGQLATKHEENSHN